MPMDAYRFFVPDLREQAATSEQLVLPEDQAHHARAVLRLEPGATVILFDGQGRWQRAVIDRVTKHAVSARAEGGLQRDELPAIQLTIATAAPKGERAEWLVEQCSQLHAAAIQWLESAFEERNGELVFLESEITSAAQGDSLHSLGQDPRVMRLLERMKLPSREASSDQESK